MTGFDLDRRVVHTSVTSGRQRVPLRQPDRGGGRRQSYFGHDEFALNAPGMKTIDDAMELRGRVFGALELAETIDGRGPQRFG